MLDTPSGPAGRRGHWHELFSKFDLSVVYIPGKDNVVADALSRWAYPASKAFSDVSIHGSAEDDALMEEFIQKEVQEERTCRVLGVLRVPQAIQELSQVAQSRIERLQKLPTLKPSTLLYMEQLKSAVAGITTRSGAKTDAEMVDSRVPAHIPDQKRADEPQQPKVKRGRPRKNYPEKLPDSIPVLHDTPVTGGLKRAPH